MGLDAAVYRDDDEVEQLLSVRIGNSAAVGYLAEIIGAQVPSASVLLTKVLNSGTHCGDRLSKEEVRQVKLELADVKQRLADDAAVKEFAATFEPVVEAALRHQRPITF